MEIVRSYKSLFDEIDFSTCARNTSCLNLCKGVCTKYQKYDGSLGNVLQDLDKTLSSVTKGNFHLSKPKHFPLVMRLVMEPPRIIRSILDYKIEDPDDQSTDILLKEALSLGLNIYKRKQESLCELRNLKQKIVDLKGREFLFRRVTQSLDQWTWKASNPACSQSTVEHLDSILDKGDVLFIALGHGGISPGMDVFLRYCDMTGSQDSIFYACRFSRAKWQDQLPRLSSRDISNLHEQGLGRQVVIFDEDVATPGDGTLARAKEFFIDRIFPGQYVFSQANRYLN
ncbi:MAG: hypothetical protein PHQ59_05375 [Candidatus Daviesbacteria bacterium]|nr:hypothetical protein [Candidatus Daviesbacteria bacterium]